MADITIYSTKSTFVRNDIPDGNYGDSTFLADGRYSGGTIFFSLVEFDLTTCPGAIKTALLYYTVYEIVEGSGSSSVVKRNTASWLENTVSWNTKPATTGNYGTFNLNAVGAKSVDITNLIKEWKAGTYSNYGLTLENAMAAGNEVFSRSDDYAVEAERPRLIITPKAGGILLLLSEVWEKHDKLWKPKILIPRESYC